MAESPREQFLTATAALLSTRLAAERPWGGRYGNAPTVARTFALIDQVNRFPHLMLLTLTAEMRSTVQERYDDVVEFVALGYITGDATTGADTWVGRFQRDTVGIVLDAMKSGGSLVQYADQVDAGPAVFEHSGRGAAFEQPFTATIPDALGVG